MTDKIIYLALVVSITGLLILAYVSEFLEPPITRIESINLNSLGKNVHISGAVTRVYEFKGGSKVITLDDNTSSVDVYLTYDVSKSFNISNSEKLDIIGTVEIYNNKLEIRVDNVNNIKSR